MKVKMIILFIFNQRMNTEQIIEDALNGNIIVYEYTISTKKLANNSPKIIQVEGKVDYSKMTDEEIDEYDNKLYLSIPHDTINIETVNKDDIIDKIKACHTILFCLVNDKYTIDLDKSFIVDISKLKSNYTLINLQITENLDLMNTDKFKILTWTDFHKCGYL